MVWALMAKFLLRQPPLLQAAVLGLCTGLFVSAMAEANERDPVLRSVVWVVAIWGVGSGALYYAGFVYQHRRGRGAEWAPPWLFTLYAAVWMFGILAALVALVGAGGLQVAVLAIVPLVLLAPSALFGIRRVMRRRSA